MKDAVIDYGSNANGCWKKFKSGRIEQWGYKTAAGYGPHTLTFPLSFKSGVHFIKTVCVRPSTSSATTNFPVNGTVSLTAATIRGAGFVYSASEIVGFYWKAKGV